MKKQLGMSYGAVVKGNLEFLICGVNVSSKLMAISTTVSPHWKEPSIYMRKVGIPTEVVEEEADVLRRKPLSAVMLYHVNNGITSNVRCSKKGETVCNAIDNGKNNDVKIGIYTNLCAREDTLKRKHTDLFKNMARIELKTFFKDEYQKLVLSELSLSIPNIDGSKLKDTAQGISNALNKEVKPQLRGSACKSTASHKSPCMLSDMIITIKLETTLQAVSTQPPLDSKNSSCEESDNDLVWNVNSIYEIVRDSLTDHQVNLNDSITRLKQLASADDASSANSETAKPNQSDTAKQKICSETCKVNPNSKKYYNTTRCIL